MESTTKTKISEEEVRKLVVKNFGKEVKTSQITELNGGMMNSVYLLSFESPVEGVSEMILKLSFDSKADILTYETHIMRAEVKFYQHMEGKDIPIPRLIKYDFSREMIDCDYFFMSKINGVLWKDVHEKIQPSNVENLKKELGRYNAVIHSVKGEYFGYIKEDSKWQFSSWYDAFRFMTQNMIQDGKKRGIDLPFDKILNQIDGNKELLNEIKEPTLVNFDMWAGNVLLKEEQGAYKIHGIIDFERTFYGDPFADFIASIMIYDDIEKEIAFINGYNNYAEKKLVITDNDKKRMNFYRLYMSLNLGIETYRFDDDYAQQVLEYVKISIAKALKAL